MTFISAFNVLGPEMIGPSSSHTAGACSIALLAQQMADSPVKDVEFVLYNSFSQTWKENLIFEKESFELLQDILEDAGELSRRMPYEKLVTVEYAEKAAE